jgi:hypothetical protein
LIAPNRIHGDHCRKDDSASQWFDCGGERSVTLRIRSIGENDVEMNAPGTHPVQLPHKLCMPRTRPRKAADLVQASVVDRDHGDLTADRLPIGTASEISKEIFQRPVDSEGTYKNCGDAHPEKDAPSVASWLNRLGKEC